MLGSFLQAAHCSADRGYMEQSVPAGAVHPDKRLVCELARMPPASKRGLLESKLGVGK